MEGLTCLWKKGRGGGYWDDDDGSATAARH